MLIELILFYVIVLTDKNFGDNNDGKNYTLQTESAYTPSTTIFIAT